MDAPASMAPIIPATMTAGSMWRTANTCLLYTSEHTKEADTPGEIPGRSGLQADRQPETSLSIMRGAWLRRKETEEIIMTLSMNCLLYTSGAIANSKSVFKFFYTLTVFDCTIKCFFCKPGLQNPSFARSLHIQVIDPKKIVK